MAAFEPEGLFDGRVSPDGMALGVLGDGQADGRRVEDGLQLGGAMADAFLELLVKPAQLLLVLPALAQVGGHDGEGIRVRGNRAKREEHREAGAGAGGEVELGLVAGGQGVGHHFAQRGSLVRRDAPAYGRADQLLGGQAGHLGETVVAVEDGPVAGNGGRALVHGFHQQAVGRFSALEREDLLARRAGGDQRIHRTAADGFNGFLGFGQPGAQLGNLSREVWVSAHKG